jgi:hypothetical protein
VGHPLSYPPVVNDFFWGAGGDSFELLDFEHRTACGKEAGDLSGGFSLASINQVSSLTFYTNALGTLEISLFY